MKKLLLLFCLLFLQVTKAQDTTDSVTPDSLENMFTYQTGTVELRNGIAKITVPQGYKYLDAVQSEKVLVELWGNPKTENMTLGMLLPQEMGVLSDESYVFNIEYDEMGFVEDDDADDMNYDDLLKDIQKDAEDANAERVKEGFEAISIIGWAATPFYDKDKKILHWAKEVKFGNSEVNTLNYNVRVLGRKGVLILNAISSMPLLPQVKADIEKVTTAVAFNEGYRYQDFDSSTDNVAAWTIGGLVAGKVLAKVGFFALIVKFWKLLILGIGALGAWVWKKFKRKKEETPTTTVTPDVPPTTDSSDFSS